MKRINENYLNIFEYIKFQIKDTLPARVNNHKENDYREIRGHLIGSFQPVVSMLNDVINTFKPYKSDYDWLKDVLQPLRGILTILKGLALIGLSILCLLFVPLVTSIMLIIAKIKDSGNFKFDDFLAINLFNLLLASSSFIDGLLSIVRGITQILTAPLTWGLRILLRLALTDYYGAPVIFENEDIIDLVNRGENAADDDKKYIVNRLHYKFEKALNRGQAAQLIKQNEEKKEDLV